MFLKPLAVVAAWLAVAVAQTPVPVPADAACVPLPDAAVVAFAVVWRHGLHDDQGELAGLARTLLACRLQRARAAVPDVTASGGDVDASTSVAWVVVDRAAADAALRFLQALADDSMALPDDGLALAQARAALAADDEAFVLPGTVLVARAQRHWFVGVAATPTRTEPATVVAAMQALPNARVRELLRVQRPRRIGALGAFTTAQWEVAAKLATTGDDAAFARTPMQPNGAAGALASEVHSRIDAPFVTAAVPVADEPLPVLAMAVAVARGRADRRWQQRAIEAVARAPFVAWSWLADEPLVLVHRRGFAHRRLLPGERAAAAAAEAAATQGEVLALLADLQQRPPSAAELDTARRSLRREFAIDGAAIAAGESRGASLWLPARLRACVRGIDVSACDRVTAADVHQLWQRRFAGDRVSWHALLPVPRDGFGFSPR